MTLGYLFKVSAALSHSRYSGRAFSQRIGQRAYSTLTNQSIAPPKLNPHFITGFTDAEGSFLILINKKKLSKIGFEARVVFQLCLHAFPSLPIY